MGKKKNKLDEKAKLGLVLFGIYSLIYATFVIINTLWPKLMGKIIFAGLNLAVIYGFFLIIAAIVMGLIYNQMCLKIEEKK
ncbi:DUF485 domain-containing protein [bacterium]|jgi:uncharacterized membrane protein (DUF485 family)|nr:DUF485 domain-containing protein [bacterium]MBT3581107.1 DUF485 domain-containing protein [bacterium]MBT4552568.1 DUF485 domain-containing protein [bacterium]MBT5988231.1 DUF485 domain-containing protein [bacterium]